MTVPDSIERHVTLRAPRERVWRAISDASEFSQWFGFTLEGAFVAGATVRGTFGGKLDEAAIRAHLERLGVPPAAVRLPDKNSVFCTVERLDPERSLSFHWIPYGIDAEADLASEPTTRVEFQLEACVEGTRVTITESGFARVPSHRRDRAFRMNEGGWAAQAENLKRHVDGS